MSNRRLTLDERSAQIAAVAARMGVRFDANETMAFSRSLEQIEQKLKAVKYPVGHAIDYIPLNTRIDPGADKYTYRVMDYTGTAKRVVNWGEDFPRVDLQGFEVSNKMHNYGASYGFDLQQLRGAKFSNFPLEQSLNTAARTVVARSLDVNLWFGDSAVGSTGLANNANVTPTTVITGTWSTATGIQIVADVQKLINAPRVASKDVERVDNVVFPLASWNIVTTKFMGNEAPTLTVLDMLKKANPGVSFNSSFRLDTADVAGTGPRVVAFNGSPETLEGLVAVEFEILPAVDQGGQLQVKVMGRFGGVAIYFPGAVGYMDGV